MQKPRRVGNGRAQGMKKGRNDADCGFRNAERNANDLPSSFEQRCGRGGMRKGMAEGKNKRDVEHPKSKDELSISMRAAEGRVHLGDAGKWQAALGDASSSTGMVSLPPKRFLASRIQTSPICLRLCRSRRETSAKCLCNGRSRIVMSRVNLWA